MRAIPIPRISEHPTATLTGQESFLRAAPPSTGTVELLVRRPAPLEREVLHEAMLDPVKGLVGDNWLSRATQRAIDEGRHLDAQITVMSSRMVALLAETDAGRAEAGDQLYMDLDISRANLPTGARIALGTDGVVLEVTAKPHNGCAKFVARFGHAAMEFVNSELGKELRLRGFNAKVLTGGMVVAGDRATKLPS